MINPESTENVLAYFSIAWIGLGVAGFVVFYLGKNIAFKRKWWPRYIIFIGMTFAGFTVIVMPFAIVMLPFIALITYLNLKTVKICNHCGRLNMPVFFTSPKFCSKCGDALGN